MWTYSNDGKTSIKEAHVTEDNRLSEVTFYNSAIGDNKQVKITIVDLGKISYEFFWTLIVRVILAYSFFSLEKIQKELHS